MSRKRSRRLSFQAETTQYLQELLAHGLRDSSVRSYGYRLKWFGQWLRNGRRGLIDVDRDIAEGWLVAMDRQGLDEKTRRDSRSALRSFFTWLVDRGRVRKNPFAQTRAIKVPRRLPEVLQLLDTFKIMDSAKPGRELVIVEMLYGSGIRRAELAGIDMEDLQLAGSKVRIRGKGGHDRMQPISKAAVEAIRAWLPERRGILETAEGGKATSARNERGETHALLVTREGRMSGNTIYNIVKDLADRAGLDQSVYPHLFRHSFATDLLNRGLDLRKVQELLGHARLQTTQIYTHLALDEIERAYHAAHPRSEPLPPADAAKRKVSGTSVTVKPPAPKPPPKSGFRLLQ